MYNCRKYAESQEFGIFRVYFNFKKGMKRASVAISEATSKRVKSVTDSFTRDIIPRKDTSLEDSLKIISWNVNGFRALIKNKKEELESLVATEQPDILCLQETKLQEDHVKIFADVLPGYHSHFSCSTSKKGYSGTAIFISKKTIPTYEVEIGIGYENHDFEGRSISVKLPFANIVALYVPNAGQKLERLDYRTRKWDLDLREYVTKLSDETNAPTIICGDLNVAHRDIDLYNPTAKHIPKTPGCTEAERLSFTAFLESGFVDAFRHLYPEAKGAFTYWSTRANNKPGNKGLRLDYFCVPESFVEKVLDTYIMSEATEGASDHCPIALVLKKD